MAEEERQKVCLAVTPIGEEGSEIRRRSDQVLRHIIEPVVEGLKYKIDRADKIPQPGMITNQIIEHLVNDDLVVADLTYANANVFYELAVRHATRKPVVSLMEMGHRIPFDVNQSRTIQVDHRDLDSVARCKNDLEQQIRALEEDPENFFTPVSVAIDMKSMRESGNPGAVIEAQMFSGIQSLRYELNNLQITVSDLRSQLEMQRMASMQQPLGSVIQHSDAIRISPAAFRGGATGSARNIGSTPTTEFGDEAPLSKEGE